MKELFFLVLFCFFSIQATSGPLNNIEGGVITNNITMNVPSEYLTVQEALSALDDKKISVDALVVIQIADGTYTNYDTIVIDNPYASRIQILGNPTNSSYVNIEFKTDVDGFIVHSGTSLAHISGLTLVGSGTAYTNGIQVHTNSSLGCSNISVSNFWTGYRAGSNSHITCSGANSSSNRAYGFAANQGSSMNVTNSVGSNNAVQGYAASKNSIITAYGSTITGNATAISVYEGGVVNAQNATLSSNGTNYNVQDSVSYIRTQ